MILSEVQLRALIRKEIEDTSDAGPMHRCHDNTLVVFGSPECIKDIEERIVAVKHMRDSSRPKSDTRAHCNGYLRILTRELRRAQKALEI